MAFRSVIFLAALAGASAFDLLPALEADNECSAKPGEHCALQALQLTATRPDAMVAKINGVLSSKLGMLNSHMAGMLRAKDPMTLHMHKGKVYMKKLYGISSLHIRSLKVVNVAPPKIIFSMSGSWKSTLKISGYASGPMGKVPLSGGLQHVSFNVPHIVATLDKNTGDIKKFSVSGTHVGIGSMYAHVQVKSHFFARIINKKANEMLRSKKGKIAGKISGEANRELNKVLNTKFKGAINSKIKSIASKMR